MDRDLKLKLFIENKIQKVLFAEVSNDVVDFLLSLLSLPIGTVTKLLTKESMVGCLGSTYGSLEKLDNDYFLSSKTKSRLLNPTSSKAAWIKSLWFSVDFDHVTPPKYYQCSGPGGLDCKPCYQRSSNYVTDVYESPCPVCKRQMTMKVEYTGEEKGFVKDAIPYIIMDDLSVSLMSTASTITLLSKFSVRDVSCLEERIVRLRRKEALGLLKASLQSKTVLTDVFLRK